MPNAILQQGASFQGLKDINWGSTGLSVSVTSNEYDALTVDPYSSVGVVRYPVPHRLTGSTEYASYVFLACPDLVVSPALDPAHSFTWSDLGGPGLHYTLSGVSMSLTPALSALYPLRLLTKAGHLWAGDGVRNLVAGAGSSSDPSAIDGLEIQWRNLSTRSLEVHLLYGLVLP